MTENPNQNFDLYASDYDNVLNSGISLSGETKDYFALKRLEWLHDCLGDSYGTALRVMDFGCGNGSSSTFVLDLLNARYLLGVDQSVKSIEIANQQHGSERIQFMLLDAYQPCNEFDLVFCNGVFHHIPPAERAAAVHYAFRCLRPGGVFSLWENNPWNPGIRYVMSRIPFDKDAIRLSAREAQQLLRNQGFEILRTDFLFIFPRALHKLRWIEFYCSRLPFGAQYQVLCRKPNK